MSEEKENASPQKICQGCGEALTGENDSEAHIIPNALGGRLKPKGIICQTCNTKLDALADKYQYSEEISTARYKLYELQALVHYFDGDDDGALDFINQNNRRIYFAIVL